MSIQRTSRLALVVMFCLFTSIGCGKGEPGVNEDKDRPEPTESIRKP